MVLVILVQFWVSFEARVDDNGGSAPSQSYIEIHHCQTPDNDSQVYPIQVNNPFDAQFNYDPFVPFQHPYFRNSMWVYADYDMDFE